MCIPYWISPLGAIRDKDEKSSIDVFDEHMQILSSAICRLSLICADLRRFIVLWHFINDYQRLRSGADIFNLLFAHSHKHWGQPLCLIGRTEKHKPEQIKNDTYCCKRKRNCISIGKEQPSDGHLTTRHNTHLAAPLHSTRGMCWRSQLLSI